MGLVGHRSGVTPAESTTRTDPPTGAQHEIRWGPHRAVVVEVGGGLRLYQHDGADVLAGYAEDELPTGARGQLLVPWPNRLHAGQYEWGGVEHQAPLNEPDQRNAMHGLTRWVSWTADQPSPAEVTMRLVLRPQPAYPFTLGLEATYHLDDDGLTTTLVATNLGAEDAPFAAGAHPYLTVGTDLIDEATLQLDASHWLPTGPSQIPIGEEPVDQTPYDFRSARRIGPLHIDYALTGLGRDQDGRARLVLASPEGRTVTFWVDGAYRYLELFTGDTLPPEGRRRSLGVEPMTSPPNAFRSGTDVVRLRPGERFEGRWGITPGSTTTT